MNHYVLVLILLFCCVSHSTRGMEGSTPNPAKVGTRVGALRKDTRIPSKDDLDIRPGLTPTAPKTIRKPSGKLQTTKISEAPAHSNKTVRPGALKKNPTTNSRDDLEIGLKRARTYTIVDRIIGRRPSQEIVPSNNSLQEAESAIKSHDPKKLAGILSANKSSMDGTSLLTLATERLLNNSNQDHLKAFAACLLIVARDLPTTDNALNNSLINLQTKIEKVENPTEYLHIQRSLRMIDAARSVNASMEQYSKNSLRYKKLHSNKE